MKIQFWENSRVVTLAAGTIIEIGVPRIRPRLSGYAGSIQGAGREAFLVDSATAIFTVYPAAIPITDFSAIITIFQHPVHATGPSQIAFPPVSRDVTTMLWVDGVLTFDLTNYGVCTATLALRNNNVAAATAFVYTRIVGDERSIDVNPSGMRDGGET